ncbi:alpha/beta fold hydrolase [Pseudomonas reactans]|uniref:epoxide hydrolase family protein n=1 Tax=Pseudomonas reactans TaxID=117680 RepID=UPI000686105E|nr:epoxide hydrolase [Pseudomonas reactans]NWC88445.1 alpha/beta fold hydrolase [Pseudomonas reactans]NWD33992.1 alpha/beta fold hydrolase [Pseudomonas reactans]
MATDLFSRRLLLKGIVAGSAGLVMGAGRAASPVPGISADMLLPPATEAVVPFRVSIPQAALDDLRLRLQLTRFPEQETSPGWEQGVPLDKARSLIEHWQQRYDWRQFEARLNAFPQFRTRIDGLGIHFIHVRSRHPGALPILMTHGWPGSIVEFLNVIDPLTNPTAHGGAASDAFDVVIPSQPGFGFSDKPDVAGWDMARTARAWAELMRRLGYSKWVAQGGDWGSGITHTLGHLRPDGLVAAHVNWPLVFPDKMPDNPTPVEKTAIDAANNFFNDQIGYFKLQATRPQTIGYSLADSPAGLATWIYEKFQAWSDNQGNPEDAISVDDMLDNITLYWLTNTGASSARIYWQNKGPGFNAGRIELPMAATIFPREIYRAPRSWAEEQWPNLIYWNEVDRGGHFAAMEQPKLFSQEMRRAFSSVR